MNVELFKEAQFTETELDRLNLLFWCLAWVFHTSPLDGHLRGILYNPKNHPELKTLEATGWCGGDPGWEIDGNNDETGGGYYNEAGQSVFRCWALADISGIEPDTAYYTVEEVRHYIRLALDNIAQQHPERTKEVQEVIARYWL